MHQVISSTGCSPYELATTAGVARDTVVRILDGTHQAITPAVAGKVTSISREQVVVHRVNAGPTRDHVAELHRKGWPDRAIAQVAGVGVATVYQVRTGGRPTVTADVADWVLGVDETLLQDRCPGDDPSLPRRASEHLNMLLGLPGVTVNRVMGVAGVSNDTIRVLRAGRVPHPAQSLAILSVDPVVLAGHADDDVRAHLRLIVDVAGVVGAATATGLHRVTVRQALAGERMTPSTKSAILAVDPLSVKPHPATKLDATATRRRLHALARAGWPMTVIARRLGREGILEPPGLRTRQVTAANRDAVTSLFHDLVHSPGPSPHAAKIALSKRWASVGEWEDGDLTDPDAWPDFPDAPHHPPEVLTAVVDTWLSGASLKRTAAATGVAYKHTARIVAVQGAWKLADQPWRKRTGQK